MYAYLLCVQHQKGGKISPEVWADAVPNATPNVIAKFVKDEKGNYYNERQSEVMGERSNTAKKNKLIGTYAHVKHKMAETMSSAQKKSFFSELKKWFNAESLIQEGIDWNTENLTERIKIAIPNAIPNAIPKGTAFIEDVDESESVNNKPKIEKKEKKRKSDKILAFPFGSDRFSSMWGVWLEFRKENDNFTYKSITSEQMALNQLTKLAKGEEDLAIKIIEQSIARSWKGFFEIKNDNKNEQRNNSNQHQGDANSKNSGDKASYSRFSNAFNQGGSDGLPTES